MGRDLRWQIRAREARIAFDSARKPSLERAVLAFILALSPGIAAAAGFEFAAKSPAFHVAIPHVPQIAMAPQAPGGKEPAAGWTGSRGAYAVSIHTRAAGPAGTAYECAGTLLRELIARPGVPTPDRMSRERLNDHAFLTLYGTREQDGVRLHGHLVSASEGQCIEVHATRLSTRDDDVGPWFEGFERATIGAAPAKKAKP